MKGSIGIRLAIRKEGPMVNAYLAQEGTMADAMLLGSLDAAIAGEPAVFDAWKALMSNIVATAVEIIHGVRPDMPEQAAPEHERSGSA